MGASKRKNDLWESVLTDLGDAWCDGQKWFADAAVLECSPQSGRVRLSNAKEAPRLSGSELQSLSDAFFRTNGNRPELHIQSQTADVQRTFVYGLDRADTIEAEAIAPLELLDAYTIRSFVVGPSNSLAHAAGIVSATQPGVQYNPLIICGGSGLGKTHLLQAICRMAVDQQAGRRVVCVSAERFARDHREGAADGNGSLVCSRYRNCDVLAIDDIELLAGNRDAQIDLLHTFDALRDAQKQIVLTSTELPQDIAEFDERLASRLLSGLVAPIDTPSEAQRIELLHRYAAARATHVPEGVIQLIAANVTGSIAELRGAFTKVVGYADITKVPVDEDLAREILDVAAPAVHLPRPVQMSRIAEDVAQAYALTVDQLKGRSRTRSITFPRQVAMYLSRVLTKHSLEEIGNFFGGRDHSTAKHAFDKIRKLSSDNLELSRIVKTLRKQILSGSE